MTPWAGLWGLVAGTVGAAAAHYAHSWGIDRPRLRPGGGVLGRDRGLRRRRASSRWASRSSRSPSRSRSCRASSTAWPTKPRRSPGGAGLVPQAVHARGRRARHLSVVLSIIFWLGGPTRWLDDPDDHPQSRARPSATRSAPPRRREPVRPPPPHRRPVPDLRRDPHRARARRVRRRRSTKAAGHQREPLRRARRCSSSARCFIAWALWRPLGAERGARQSRRAAGPGATGTTPSGGAGAGRQQRQHGAAEAAADHPRAGGAGALERARRSPRPRAPTPRSRRAGSRARRRAARPTVLEVARVQRRDGRVDARVLAQHVARAAVPAAPPRRRAASGSASRRYSMPSASHAARHSARRSL